MAPEAGPRIDALRAEIFPHTIFGRFAILDSESRLIYGNTQHVLPYVLDRILREAAGLTAAESNECISKVFEAHFARRQARLDETRRERAGLVKQLRRHKDTLRIRLSVKWQISSARWDRFLAEILQLPVPDDSLAIAPGTDDRLP